MHKNESKIHSGNFRVCSADFRVCSGDFRVCFRGEKCQKKWKSTLEGQNWQNHENQQQISGKYRPAPKKMIITYYNTCQVRVDRFYVGLPASSFLPPLILPGHQLQALDRSVSHRTSQDQSVPSRTFSTSSREELSPPQVHRRLWSRVFPTAPPPRRISTR